MMADIDKEVAATVLFDEVHSARLAGEPPPDVAMTHARVARPAPRRSLSRWRLRKCRAATRVRRS